MTQEPISAPDEPGYHRHPREAFRVVFVIAGALILPAAFALRSVVRPGKLLLDSSNPSPYGYTWSLLLFLIPLTVVGIWFIRRHDLILARRAFWRTIGILAPVGFLLDLLFGNTFFTFLNTGATLGITVPARGGTIPIEEFVFYLTGFMLVLLSYIWADEYWVRAYNIPDYHSRARELRRIMRFHPQSAILGACLVVGAIVYKKVFAGSPAGFPGYFVYLTVLSFVPSAGFFGTAQPFINWRAFGFTFFLILLISLLWEVTLAVPYGWWGFKSGALVGLNIGAWHDLPIEEVFVWMAVSYTTVITYEVIKIWQALGKRAVEAFFGAAN